MFSRTLKDLTKTIGFRLTIWYSLVFIFSVIILFVMSYLIFYYYLKIENRSIINVKLQELISVYESDDIGGLEKEIAIDKKFGKKNPYFVRLSSPQSKTLLLVLPYQWIHFDLEALGYPPPDKSVTWKRVSVGDHGSYLEVASVHLKGGFLLQVGKSTEEHDRILRYFREVFAGVMIPLLLFGFAGGGFLSFKALRPIRNLIHAVRSIDSGQMDARVPSSHTGDELDELIILFNQMLARISALIHGMRDSLDNVAHDLRTPIMRLRGTAEIALQSNTSTVNLKEALSDCLEESELILKMLDTMMDISEAEAGTIKLELERVNVLSILNQVIDIYLFVADEKQIDVSIHCPKDLSVRMDQHRMRQALANLLDNAIKFTPKGGQVDLEAKPLQKEVVISIKDNGCGIPSRELPKIWQRLYRADQSRSEKGIGLGLSLVMAIVHAHGGRVEVNSQPQKGSTFKIYLAATN